MYPLAQILHSEGYEVTGSDSNPSSTLDAVRRMGIEVRLGHAPENLGDCGLVVYTAAVFADNPELAEARRRGIPLMPRAELLGIIANSYASAVAVCGTHGKTTSTAMLTETLVAAGKDPAAVIGGKLPSIGGSGRTGGGEYMCCEACEFRDTFLSIFPAYSLILNISEDHLEYFKNLDNIKKSFGKFASQTKKTVIANGDDDNTLSALAGCGRDTVFFGTRDFCSYKAGNITRSGPFFAYDLFESGRYAARVSLSVPGRHNVLNSLGVIAAAELCGTDTGTAVRAVSDFKGVKRRFETVGKFNGFTLIDDYAHNPEEISGLIATAGMLEHKRIIAVFQPVTFSRTRLLLEPLAEALGTADEVILLPILGAREKNTYGISSEELAGHIPGCTVCGGFESAARQIVTDAGPGDIVLIFGCGDIYKMIPFIEKLTGKDSGLRE